MGIENNKHYNVPLEMNDVEEELKEVQREIKLMARYSTMVGDMIMSKKIMVLYESFKKLKERLRE